MAKNTYYLTTGPYTGTDHRRKGHIIAVISLGQVQRGDDNCIMCSCTVVKDKKEAKAWFDREMETKSWEKEWDNASGGTN